MSASIRDVAQRAGVSISTASRALNQKPDVEKNVRARILAAAQELNYAVNLHARVLGGGRSRTLGLIISNSADPFFAALARGVSDAATSGGYSLIIWNTDEAIDRELPRAILDPQRQLRRTRHLQQAMDFGRVRRGRHQRDLRSGLTRGDFNRAARKRTVAFRPKFDRRPRQCRNARCRHRPIHWGQM